MKNLLGLLSILSIIFLGCKKNVNPCPDSKTNNYFIESGTLEKIPYTGYEKLVFISSTGDTARFSGQGIKQYTKEYSDHSSLNPDCSKVFDYWRKEVKEYQYYGNSPHIDGITFIVHGGMVQGGGANGPVTGVDTDLEGFIITSQGMTLLAPGTPSSYANDTTKYTESITINGTPISTCRIGDVWFNNKYGLIQFKDTTQNKTWTISL